MAYPPPPYKDAVCGVPVCGEAVCGTKWSYPLRGLLSLAGRQVTLQLPPVISMVVQRGVLVLRGRLVDFVGQQWLFPIVCQDDVLVAAVGLDMVAVASPERDTDLQPIVCR